MNTFSELPLIAPLQRALEHEGYNTPTPVQQLAIPHVTAGRDLLGCAQTGTGKTAAFALPSLQRLHEANKRPQPKSCRALVLTPTRELAIQVEERFSAYGRFLQLSSAVIFGGVGQNPQVKVMATGVDVLVATPGRLLDLMEQGHVRLDHVELFVLDEADRMLDMGFIHDVRKVIARLPKKRQSLFFSATMPRPIVELAGSILSKPARVDVSPEQPTVERIEQTVMHTSKAEKPALLRELLQDTAIERAIVFTRTKHGANKVVKQLAPGIEALAIHGNKSQNARQKALESFRTGDIRVLVATDIAARGIDVDGITHVFNYDLPDVPEQYVHRIGRTARAGASGRAVSFCDPEERSELVAVERLIGRRIPVAAAPQLSPAALRPVEVSDGRREPRRGGREQQPRRDQQQVRREPQPARRERQPVAARPASGLVGQVVWHSTAAAKAQPSAAAPRPAAPTQAARSGESAGEGPRRPRRRRRRRGGSGAPPAP